MGLLLTELIAQLTGGHVPDEPESAPPSAPTRAQLAKARAFWHDHLEPDERPLSLPVTPGRGAREPAVLVRETSRTPLNLGKKRTAAIDTLAKECGVTRHTALVAGQALALASLTGADRIPVGIPLHGRGAGTVGKIGYLASPVALPIDLPASATGRRLLTESHALVTGALAHQRVDYAELVGIFQQGDRLHVPVPDLALILHQDTPGAPPGAAAALLGNQPLDLGGLLAEPVVPLLTVGPFALATVLADQDGALSGRVEVDPARLQPWFGPCLAAALIAALDELTAHPDCPLGELSLLSSDDHARLRSQENGARLAPVSETLHSLVLRTAERLPGQTAVVTAEGQLTYRELADRSALIAAYLAAKKVGRGDAVGLLLPRDGWLIPAMLGVLRAGAAYVPLDPAAPPPRIRASAVAAGCSALLTAGDASDRFRESPVPVLSLSEVASDPLPGDNPAAASTPPVKPGDPAYVLTTSGSTGTPKGVRIPHSAAVNLIRWANAEFRAEELALTLAVTPITFDLSVFEIFAPLADGGQVVLLDSVLDLLAGPAHAAGATLLNTVPSAVLTLAEHHSLPATLRAVNVAGEPATAELAARVHAALPQARLVNLYGPSETTTYSTFAVLPPDISDPVPIGRPIASTTVRVVDSRLRRLPVGAAGELLIGGAGVANGYPGRPALTAARFLPDPDSIGGRLYRTGDLARWRPDGMLEFLGRADHQVKIRGVRIELGEVEACLRRLADLLDVAVTTAGDTRNPRLVAHLVPAVPIPGDPADWLRGLRQRMARELPAVFLPAEFSILDVLPRTAHGKVNRRALTDVQVVRLQTGHRAPPVSVAERRVAAAWSAVLGTSDIGVDDHFFELGGHSLMLVQLAGQLTREFNRNLPLQLLWQHSTVAEQARLLTAEPAAGGADALAELPPISGIDRHRAVVIPEGEQAITGLLGEDQ
jgi:amino acid adenylation domain-containing protein